MSILTNNNGLIERANDLKTEGKFEEALEILDNLYKKNPESKEVKKCLIDVLFSYGGYLSDEDYVLEYEKAKECFQKIIQIDPDNYRGYYNLGIAYYNLDDKDNALEVYKKALKIKPNYKHVYYNIGLIYESLQDYKKALNYYQKALDIDPKFHYAFQARNNVRNNLDFLKEKNIKLGIKSTQIDKLKVLLKNSKKIKIKMIQILLNINYEEVTDLVISWVEKYHFKIDGDFLNINKDTIHNLLEGLDHFTL